MCLDLEEGKDVHSGVTAFWEGHSDIINFRGIFGENNVTVITNDQCREILHYNSTRRVVRRTLSIGLPYGLNDMFLCTQGIQDSLVREWFIIFDSAKVWTHSIEDFIWPFLGRFRPFRF